MRQQITIEGMGCDHCVTAVREALENVAGVHVRNVEIGSAVVDIEADAAAAKAIEEAIREAGYEPVSRVDA